MNEHSALALLEPPRCTEVPSQSSPRPESRSNSSPNGECLDLFELVDGLVTGQLDAEEWRARCESIGISALELGASEEPVAQPR